MHRTFITAAVALAYLLPVTAHDGPTPLLHWSMNPKFVDKENTLTAQKGPNVPLEPNTKSVRDRDCLTFASTKTPRIGTIGDEQIDLPRQNFTITAVASIHTPRKFGGLFSAIQDNGGEERGVVLGYDKSHFSIALSTAGANDGDGFATYLKSKTPYELGKLYHISATYDGETLSLYVNGKLEASTNEQSGDILYADNTPIGVAGYVDDNEDHPHHGEIHHLRVYDQCALPAAVVHDSEDATPLTQLPATAPNRPLQFLVHPYLQFATTDSITVMWETTTLTESAEVRFGESDRLDRTEDQIQKTGNIHEAKLTGLKPDTQYFYQARCTKADGTSIQSEVSTFRTAPSGATPFAFAIISDTQHHHKTAAATLAGHAWNQRPSFLLHPGDLVDDGNNKDQWVQQFFTSLRPLTSRMPFYPVLGNHERNAKLYYDYVSLPDPEYYYTFHYGNAQFFMVDTNKKIDPGSEQYLWLEKQLSESTADWKFLCHHQPAYTSDGDDYGDLWKSNRSSAGDLNARHLTQLCDKHQVDIVFNGHIHNYERTWPINNGHPTSSENGTLYLIAGGGGGVLEQFAPTRHPFTNYIRRTHHYVMIHINGGELEYRAFDLENRLFDQFTLKSKRTPEPEAD